MSIIIKSTVSEVSLLNLHYGSLINLAFGAVSFNPSTEHKDHVIRVSG